MRSRHPGYPPSVLSLDQIRGALVRHRPVTTPDEASPRAAVALLLRQRRAGTEILLIERARREGDPWSGHMAFPGGRLQPEDASARHAAERETREEVGIAVEPAHLLGRLDDLPGRHAGRRFPLVISAFVYGVSDAGEPRVPNEEVRSALWVPTSELLDPQRHIEHVLHRGGGTLRYPGIAVGGAQRRVVWGLTYRFLEVFLAVAGRPLPDRWEGFPGSDDAPS